MNQDDKPKCETCEHFWETSVLRGGEETGECHYNPPQIIVANAQLLGMYPPCRVAGGCRHHQNFMAAER